MRWAKVVQRAVIHQQVESVVDVLQVGEVILDERNLDAGLTRSNAAHFEGRGSVVHTGYIEPVLCQVDDVAGGAAAEVNRPAGLDASALHQAHEFITRPGVKRYRYEGVAVHQLINPFHIVFSVFLVIR